MAGLRTVREHADAVAELIVARPRVSVLLADALGLVLAEDVCAPIPLPPFDNSAMDGYAVHAGDLATACPGSPVTLRVVADIPAGRTDMVSVPPGAAARIMTGAPMPRGAGAVVPVEATDRGLTVVTMSGPVAPGRNVRWAGEEIARGGLAITAGTVLTDVHIGLLASVGRRTVPVTPPPRVLIITAGDELVMPGATIAHGQVFASNGVMLASAVRAAGAIAVLTDPLPDDPGGLRCEIDRHAAAADMILTAGGISAGSYEVVKEALAGRGVEFMNVAMRPGMPQGAGRYEGIPLIALPGNPMSAWISFEVFVRPALRHAMRYPRPSRTVATMVLDRPIASSTGHRHFLPAVYDPATLTVSPVKGSVPHSLKRLSDATCLMDINEETAELGAGSRVPVWLLS